MAYLPVNARSEFVTPVNSSAGGLFDSSRRFHCVSAARSTIIRFVVSFGHFAVEPARRPTRGSGLGGDIDMSAAGDGDDDDDDDDMAQASANNRPAASDRESSGRATGFT